MDGSLKSVFFRNGWMQSVNIFLQDSRCFTFMSSSVLSIRPFICALSFLLQHRVSFFNWNWTQLSLVPRPSRYIHFQYNNKKIQLIYLCILLSFTCFFFACFFLTLQHCCKCCFSSISCLIVQFDLLFFIPCLLNMMVTIPPSQSNMAHKKTSGFSPLAVFLEALHSYQTIESPAKRSCPCTPTTYWSFSPLTIQMLFYRLTHATHFPSADIHFSIYFL